jgi:hypothetical protein
MSAHRIGDISISQVIEQRGAGFAPDFLFPDWDPAVLEQHKALMIPQCFDEAARPLDLKHPYLGAENRSSCDPDR